MHLDWSKKNPYWVTVDPDAEYVVVLVVVVVDDIFYHDSDKKSWTSTKVLCGS